MIDQLIHKIKLRQADIERSLSDGFARTYDHYQHLVGLHSGLQEAQRMIERLLDEEKNAD